MKMILKLLFMSRLWLGVIGLNNVRHVKKSKQRINVCSMVSYKVSEDEKKRSKSISDSLYI